ncbi:MAG: UDP-N-acetylmuramate--L-alanine ligase [Pseudomonadota bacterium]|nr:UDP-N-acetylmuramate--L-alanine ligase [Pseudomonadota bacterium]
MNLKALPLAHKLPLNVGIIHFIGIGGIGMSGIAEVLHNLGYQVQGSDAADSYNTQRLKDRGIEVFVGHAAKHVGNASVVVVSSAIKPENHELAAARELRLPVVRRAEMLAELMRFKIAIAVAGTHGKTTTTALTAAMLEAANLGPTVINGGIINGRDTNAYLGAGEWMVVEADESDGTFTRLPATIAVITNIDPEHLDYYGSFDNAKAAYQTFLTNLPFYGFAVLCTDHPEVQALAGRITDRRIVTYGTNKQADFRAVNLCSGPEGESFDVEISERGQEPRRVIKNILLPMYGHHNVRNALAAIAIGCELGMKDAAIVKALHDFGGVKRRFTKTGEGLGIAVIDDYGHHPVEIAATLRAARGAQNGKGEAEAQVDAEARRETASLRRRQVIAVVQPHRYTRLHDLFDEFCTCFNDADVVVVADIYGAGEDPIEGITADKLVGGLRAAGHKHVIKLESPEQLAKTVASVAKSGDMAVCLGAGSITKWAYALPSALEALKGAGFGMQDSGKNKAQAS